MWMDGWMDGGWWTVKGLRLQISNPALDGDVEQQTEEWANCVHLRIPEQELE